MIPNKTFRANTWYELKESDDVDYPQHKYVLTGADAEGLKMAECILTNDHGEPHPFFTKEHPTLPFCISETLRITTPKTPTAP